MNHNQNMRNILASFNKLTEKKNLNESTLTECPPEVGMSEMGMDSGGQISITGDVGSISDLLSKLATIDSGGRTTQLPALDDPKIPGKDRDPFDSDSEEGMLGKMAGGAIGGAAGAVGGPVGSAVGSAVGSTIGDKMTDEWDNDPDPEYKDTDYMTKDIAGGLNREKGSYAPTAGGDNPMALDDDISLNNEGEFFDKDAQLGIKWSYDEGVDEEINISAFDEGDNEVQLDAKKVRRYQEMIRDELQAKKDEAAEAKDAKQVAVEAIKARLHKALAEAKAKPDFLDVDKDGNKKEPMKKALKDKTKGKVDELSPSTLKSYAKKASSSDHKNSSSNLSSRAAYALAQDDNPGSRAGEKDDAKSARRSKYVGKAIDKMTSSKKK